MDHLVVLVLMAEFQFTTSHAIGASTLFRRQCVPCPPGIPQCPTCASDETCASTVQTCSECAAVKCIKIPGASSSSGNNNKGGSGKTSLGGVAGGIIGGLVVIAIVGFFIFRYFRKKRTQRIQSESYQFAGEKNSTLGQLRDARASTHTVTSIASTVLTRASNVIQIAYIPGVTNRSNPGSPGFSIPPVPAIPGQHVPNENDVSFSANDILRQSMWSTAESTADPRASVATTIYRKNAVISPMAGTAVRAKAAVVTVKPTPSPSNVSEATTPDNDHPPPVPAIDFKRIPSTTSQLARSDENGLRESLKPPRSPAFSVGSTFINKTTIPPPTKKAVPPTLDLARQSRIDLSPFSDTAAKDDEEILTPPRRPSELGLDSPGTSAGRSSPATFREGDIRMSFRPISGCSEMETETPKTPHSPRGRSPFSDEHRVKE